MLRAQLQLPVSGTLSSIALVHHHDAINDGASVEVSGAHFENYSIYRNTVTTFQLLFRL